MRCLVGLLTKSPLTPQQAPGKVVVKNRNLASKAKRGGVAFPALSLVAWP